jgi:hypothetical protein
VGQDPLEPRDWGGELRLSVWMRPEWNRSLKHENERTARSSGRLLLSERVASTDSQPWARPIRARVIGNSDVQQREQVVAIAKTKKEEKEESLYCACEQADFGVVNGGLFVGWDAGKLLRGSAWPR